MPGFAPRGARAVRRRGGRVRRRSRRAGDHATALARPCEYPGVQRRSNGRIPHGAVRHAGAARCGPAGAAKLAAERRVFPEIQRRLPRHLAGFCAGPARPRSLFPGAARLRQSAADGETAGERHSGAAALLRRCLGGRSRRRADAVAPARRLGAPDCHALPAPGAGRAVVVAARHEPHRAAEREPRPDRRLLPPPARHRGCLAGRGSIAGFRIGRTRCSNWSRRRRTRGPPAAAWITSASR